MSITPIVLRLAAEASRKRRSPDLDGMDDTLPTKYRKVYDRNAHTKAVADEKIKRACDHLSKTLDRQTMRKGDHIIASKTPWLCAVRGLGWFTPVQAVYFLRNKKRMDETTVRYQQSPSCNEPKCVSHRLVRTRNLSDFCQCTYGDYQFMIEYMEKYTKSDGDCLLWTGKLTSSGYGECGIEPGLFQSKRAHVVAWCIWNFRTVPEGCVVRHRCPKRHRHCVSDIHLDIGTRKDNAQDAIIDGTHVRGENSKGATITETTAIAIKASKGTGTQGERAARFGTTPSIVRDIDAARTWRHLFTADELEKIESKRYKQLAADVVLAIRASKGEGTIKRRAEKFGVAQETVRKIDLGRVHKNITTNGSYIEQTESMRSKYYESTKTRIQRRCEILQDAESKEHWIWQGPKTADGYGRIKFYGRNRMTHVVSWIVFANHPSDELPVIVPGERTVMRHGCKYHACCNPACLRGPGTDQDNATDAIVDRTAANRRPKRRVSK